MFNLSVLHSHENAKDSRTFFRLFLFIPRGKAFL
jgi:hypothetical protein